MYKLARWLYDLGQRHMYDQLRNDLMAYTAQEPRRWKDSDHGMQESEEHFMKRRAEWFANRRFVDDFFAERDNSELTRQNSEL